MDESMTSFPPSPLREQGRATCGLLKPSLLFWSGCNIKQPSCTRLAPCIVNISRASLLPPSLQGNAKARQPFPSKVDFLLGRMFSPWVLTSIAVVLKIYFHSICAWLATFCQRANCVPVYQAEWLQWENCLEQQGLRRGCSPWKQHSN